MFTYHTTDKLVMLVEKMLVLTPKLRAAKAYHLYPRHKHFHKMLNRPGNRGRHNLYVYMRHWTCSWLKRERYALYKKLPWSFALGVALYSRRVRTPEPGHTAFCTAPIAGRLTGAPSEKVDGLW